MPWHLYLLDHETRRPTMKKIRKRKKLVADRTATTVISDKALASIAGGTKNANNGEGWQYSDRSNITRATTTTVTRAD